MFTRLAASVVLVGTLSTLSLSPTLALPESPQDAAIVSLQAAVASLQNTMKSQAATIAAQQTRINSQQTTIQHLQRLLSGFSRGTDKTRAAGKEGTELYLTGMNLHIVNGLGATNGEPSNPYSGDLASITGGGDVLETNSFGFAAGGIYFSGSPGSGTFHSP